MDGDIPPSIPENLRSEIREKLWQANVLYRNGASVTECLECAYDAYAASLDHAGLLTSELVQKEIPAVLVKWVVIFRWRAPRLYHSAPRQPDTSEGVPRPMLGWSVPQRGNYMSLALPVAEWTLLLIQSVLLARIGYWHTRLPQAHPAETASPKVADPPVAPGPSLAMLNRIIARQNIRIETWAVDHRLSRTVVFDWKRAGGKPVKGKVSKNKVREIEAVIWSDAAHLGLKCTGEDGPKN